jgi:hypothetical protein
VLCSKAQCAPLVATIEATLLGSASAKMAALEGGSGGAGAAAAAEYDALAEEENLDSLGGEVEEADLLLDGEGGVGGEGQHQLQGSTAVLKFVNEWLGAVSDAAVGLLLAQIVEFPELTTVGCAQLLTDLEYLR